MSGLLVLAGDVGGTNARLAFFEAGDDGALREAWSSTYASAEHPCLEAIVARAIQDSGLRPAAASVGVAGPVIDGACRTTNLPWEVSEEALAAAASLPRARLLNDLAATAWGLAAVPASGLAVLHAGEERPGPQALIAAGTGLGEAWIVREGTSPIVGASEGGHASFAPRDELEDGLLAFLRARLGGGHVSWERVVSGPGLADLLEYLGDSGRAPVTPGLARRVLESGAQAVTEAADAGDPAAITAVRRFARLYGAEAGNLALKVLATGGVFVAGGMAPRMRRWIEGVDFVDGFLDKGRMRDVLRRCPVRLVLDDRAALAGAARHALAGA